MKRLTSISINILVGSSNNSISGFDLLFDRFSIRVSKRVLANIILRMVLCAICGHSLDYRDNSLGYWSYRNLNLFDSRSRISYRNLNLLHNGGGQRNRINHSLGN